MPAAAKVRETPSLEIVETSNFTNISNAIFENFHKICRFCLSFENVKPFLEMTYRQSSVQSIIFDCLSLKINPEDLLPYNSCVTCITELIRCYKFRNKCIQVDTMLRDAYCHRNLNKRKNTTQSNNSECNGSIDNLIIKEENIEDSPSYNHYVVEDTDYNNSVIKNETICDDISDDAIVVIKNKDIFYDATICNGMSDDNTCDFIKHEEIEETLSICCDRITDDGSSDNLLMKNEEIGNKLIIRSDNIIKNEEIKIVLSVFDDYVSGDTHCDDLSDNRTENIVIDCHKLSESKPAEITLKETMSKSTVYEACSENHWKETYRTRKICNDFSTGDLTIKNKDGEALIICDDNISEVHFPVKNEETKIPPVMCNAYISASTDSNYLSGNETENIMIGDRKDFLDQIDENHKLSQRKSIETLLQRTKSKSTLYNYEAYSETQPKNFNLCEQEYRICKICKNRFKKDEIKEYFKGKSYICISCSQTLIEGHTYTELKSHMKIRTEKEICKICRKSFPQKSHLKKHMLIHIDHKPYKCPAEKSHTCSICKKSFTRVYSLNKHMLIHKGDNPHKCTVCAKSFSQKYYLKEHMLIHPNEKTHKCNVCSKSFTHKSNIYKHMLIHTTEKSYKCPVCAKSFLQKYYLDQHMIIHTDKKQHTCTVCKKSFFRKSNHDRHVLIHMEEKPHKCSVCEKSFGQKYNLKKHMLIHADKKPYKCDVCEKYFIQKRDLMEHILIHTGEKPHQCTICKKPFTRKQHVKAHMRTHSKNPRECNV